MVFEAQILLRRDSPQQLADDVQAISEFIEQRRQSPMPAARERESGIGRHLRAVPGRGVAS
jgi:hypothetical protein